MNAARASMIRTVLEQALAPASIDVTDDSAAHAGHAGAREGGHFSVVIVSEQFRGQSRLERHRQVYRALGDLRQQGIHALAIAARTPEETT